jgi:Putative Actinobacterial Holin-X, holin superfamily III
MPTRAGDAPGVGTSAKQVAEHASTLAKLELELAGLELKRKAGAFGAGVGLGIGAAVVGLYAVGFLFATVAVALATVLDLWLAVLLVSVGLLALAGTLGLLAVIRFKRATPPVPEQAIREAKLTTEALKANGHR